MKLIRFIGDGTEEMDPRFLHLPGAFTDHTLCGDTLDGDPGTAGAFEEVIAPAVTCPACVQVIVHCRGVRVATQPQEERQP